MTDRYQSDFVPEVHSITEPAMHGSTPLNRLVDPKKTHAYLVGAGIASLAAATFLIHDAHVPAAQIHILEASTQSGGSMDGSGNPETGYILRGGRMLNFSYRCLYDLLSTIPSLTDPKVTVMDEINNFNAVPGNKTHANARIVKSPPAGDNKMPVIADARDFELSRIDRLKLMEMFAEGEKGLERKPIAEFFSEGFFRTNFWYMWATMFAFQPWHSAIEFRRYLHRFIHELPRIDTLAGVDRTPYNQYDSIIVPLTTYLLKQGVDFRYDTKVSSLSYAESKHITVEEIHLTMPTSTGIIHVHKSDIVLITLGSMTSSSTLGTNHTAPSSATSPANLSTDESWKLWESLSNDSPNFGHPANFSTRVPESHWQSFTVTLKSPELLTRLAEFTHNAPGTGALTTFADSNWLLSIVVPHQPHFLSQPPDVQVFWGYGLYPSRTGNFVTKPMTECSGEEILTELLSHLHFSPIQPYLDAAITIPCSMPYITSQFLTRGPGDRPQVIPLGSTNLAFMGQFVEIPLDVVFTVEYSVRGALMAVAGLMGLEKRPRGVYKGDHDPRVMIKVLKAMIEDGLGGCGPTRSSDRGGDSVDRKVDVPLGFPVFI